MAGQHKWTKEHVCEGVCEKELSTLMTHRCVFKLLDLVVAAGSQQRFIVCSGHGSVVGAALQDVLLVPAWPKYGDGKAVVLGGDG